MFRLPWKRPSSTGEIVPARHSETTHISGVHTVAENVIQGVRDSVPTDSSMGDIYKKCPWAPIVTNERLKHAMSAIHGHSLAKSVVPLGTAQSFRTLTIVPLARKPHALTPSSPSSAKSTPTPPPLRPEVIKDMFQDLISEGRSAGDDNTQQQIAASLDIFSSYMQSLFVHGGPSSGATLEIPKQRLMAMLFHLAETAKKDGRRSYSDRVGLLLKPFFISLTEKMKLDKVQSDAARQAQALFG